MIIAGSETLIWFAFFIGMAAGFIVAWLVSLGLK